MSVKRRLCAKDGELRPEIKRENFEQRKEVVIVVAGNEFAASLLGSDYRLKALCSFIRLSFVESVQ